MKRPMIIAIAGAAVVIIALGLTFMSLEGQAPTQKDAAPPTTPAQPATPAKPVAEAPKAPEPVLGFDVVRIDPEGNTVIAGKAAPNAKISILDGAKAIGAVTADQHGEWVFLPDVPLEPGSRELSLSAVNPDGKTVTAKDVVVLVVPERKGEKTLAVKAGEEGSQVLQGLTPLSEKDGVLIDSVDYTEDGSIIVAGRGKPQATLQLYLDNALIGKVESGADGLWRAKPESKASKGAHMLRADLLASDGKVLARAEMPFSRVEVAGMPEGVRVVVQPGNSLWLLARRAYGDGKAYTVIFDANKGQIRNPDLIYPGQVFIVPKD